MLARRCGAIENAARYLALAKEKLLPRSAGSARAAMVIDIACS